MKALKLCSLSFAIGLAGCQLQPAKPETAAPTPEPVQVFSEAEVTIAKEQADALIAQYEKWDLDSSPMSQAYRGLKTQYDQWDNLTESYADQLLQQAVIMRGKLRLIQTEALPAEARLNLDLLAYDLDQSIEYHAYRHYNYPINPMYGLHTEVPNFLINIHQIKNIDDAQNFIARVENVETLFEQLIEQLKIRESKGIYPPSFVYENAISTVEDLLKGYPLDKSSNLHPVWKSFIDRVEVLDLYESSEAVLEKKLKRAVQKQYAPAYRSLLKHLKQTKQFASQTTGFHQFNEGLDFYHLRLKHITTTQMNADQIHQLGIQKVAEIHQKIQLLLPALGETDLNSLFERTRSDRSLYYLSGDTALAETKEHIKRANQQLGSTFKNIPNLPMQVKPVEYFRQASSPVAFYQPGSEDGKRPGTYYMNLGKLNEMPKFQFEALTYHETIPGHHLQTIYAMQNTLLPDFRRYAHYTAYSEGWALYAEGLGYELGGYKNAWNQYGQLLMELWRACRLVLDTGLHHKGWDLDTALNYRLTHTPFTRKDSIDAIERYLVMPGQATAYMVGQMKFQSLRQTAEQRLGKKFDVAEFHAFILRLGPLPLDLLETQVNRWIQAQDPKA